MTYIVTEVTAAGRHTYSAIGTAAALMDAAYARGALGVTLMARP